MAAHCFGVTSMGAIYGLMMTASNLSGALGPIAAGYLFDLTDSYTTVFLAIFALLFIAVYCTSLIKDTR